MKENWKRYISYVVVLVLGIGVGIGGYWYYTVKLPEQRAYKLAQEQSERFNSMVRTGKVLSIKEKEIALQVMKKGREDITDQNLIEKIKVSDETIIQEGMDHIKPPGESFLLRDYIQEGMNVDLLVENGEALILHFDKRVGSTEK
ncbi:hypothetical protein [Desulforamulus ruminis]|uniref:Uncharacterized protein n=1 Tax=Desulforamulus ruminis (strain ATCC 23193 / DSM 2154 / NCIMB 8452 / DL) TaxID=696281 RepID=F6DTE3_DESRL|nr:hypothetical protein [Desulforamulus ruminis]AEG58960.1 hypothetical protein Desru_0675 [Desulforamulus ruminis DSM 2154]